MTATNICSNFGGFRCRSPLMFQYALALDVLQVLDGLARTQGRGEGGALASPFQINDIQLANLKHPFIDIFDAHLHFSNHF